MVQWERRKPEHSGKDMTILGDLRVGPLVRAIGSDRVAIWTEWNSSCEVRLTVWPAEEGERPGLHSTRSRTVTIGERYYALSLLTNLEAATWYSYRVEAGGEGKSTSQSNETELLQCFRTLDAPERETPLRLAYGSCRKLSAKEPDALSAFGSWLLASQTERESLWPHVLLLIGDQIYADESPGNQARTFEDFASLYGRAWTCDGGIRQVLALLPTSMICDDHEVTNNWGIQPSWLAWFLQQGQEQILVDGLVAYWIYQGWGNPAPYGEETHELQTVMQRAEESGEDILEVLRARVRQAVCQEHALPWDYTLPTMPPLFVIDARANRPAQLPPTSDKQILPRIISQEQMARLQNWVQDHQESTVLLASSVPTLLPPVVGLAEYLMGLRLWHRTSLSLLRRLGNRLAARQQKIAFHLSFEHWPGFSETWQELIRLFSARQRDMVILSGDVHFSYAIQARRTFFPRQGEPLLYQLVSSPFKNTLEQRERKLIRAQSWIKRAIYGGLSHRVLPLRRTPWARYAPGDMLWQNVIALVTLTPRGEGKYTLQQIYLGVGENSLEKVGETDFFKGYMGIGCLEQQARGKS